MSNPWRAVAAVGVGATAFALWWVFFKEDDGDTSSGAGRAAGPTAAAAAAAAAVERPPTVPSRTPSPAQAEAQRLVKAIRAASPDGCAKMLEALSSSRGGQWLLAANCVA
jgi:hypothetical protein